MHVPRVGVASAAERCAALAAAAACSAAIWALCLCTRCRSIGVCHCIMVCFVATVVRCSKRSSQIGRRGCTNTNAYRIAACFARGGNLLYSACAAVAGADPGLAKLMEDVLA